MVKIGVVADDFTGTASSGMMMAKAQVETGLFFDAASLDAFEDTDRLEALRQELLPWTQKEGISLAYSNPYYLEVFPAASGKGAAVRKLCELLSINPAFSLAAGDAENDISMITEAGTGIAMTNATEAVKKAATTITLYDNDHDGLAHTIEDMI